jgi:hypothetical protein
MRTKSDGSRPTPTSAGTFFEKWPVFAAACIALVLAFAMKLPCLVGRWGPPGYLQYKSVCYTDLMPLYGLRGLDRNELPYVENKTYEYPAVIGLEMWAASFLASDYRSFFLANIPFLAGAGLIAVYALTKALGARWRRALLFAAAPPFVFYAFHNWDLLAVAPVALAAWAWKNRRHEAVGFFLGVGAAAKVFPVLGLAPLSLAAAMSGNSAPGGMSGTEKVGLLNNGDPRWHIDFGAAFRLVAGFVAAWFSFNLPLIALELLTQGSIEGWLSVYRFHSRRTPDFGTLWYWWAELAAKPRVPSLIRSAGAALALAPALFAMVLVHRWISRRSALAARPSTRSGGSPACTGSERGPASTGSETKPASTGSEYGPGLGWIKAVVGIGILEAVVVAGQLTGAAQAGPTSPSFKSFVDGASLLLVGISSLWLVGRQWRYRLSPWATFGALTCAFLLFSKVHSPQYAIWLLVFFALSPTHPAYLVGYFLSDAILLVSGFWWFATAPDLSANFWRAVFVVAVLARASFLGLLVLGFSGVKNDYVGATSESDRLEFEWQAAGSPASETRWALDGGGKP